MVRRVKDSTEKRPYRSELRRRQAEATRASVLDAVRLELAEGGLASLTVRSVAERAGVAYETVYAAFRSKAGLLAAVGRHNLEEAVGAPGGASRLQELVDAERIDDQLALLARIGPEIMARNWPVLEAMRGGAASDPELAGLYAGASSGRRAWMRRLVATWRARGALRPGLRTDDTVDALWALTSPDLYRLLVVERGWSDARYGRWLADAVATLALAEEHRPGPASH